MKQLCALGVILAVLMGAASPEPQHDDREKSQNVILLSGGPTKYDPKEDRPAGELPHDTSWSSFVTAPGLLFKEGRFKPTAKLQVWWFVHKPSYEVRWEDDLKATDHRKKSIEEVKKKGYKSYVDMIEGLAKDRGWKLSWIDSAADFWKKTKTFKDPVLEFVYWGHARHDLWLTCRHIKHVVSAPPKSDRILRSEIAKSKLSFASNATSEFFGCNTRQFAEKWSGVFKTKSFGYDGTIHFGGLFDDPLGIPTFEEQQRKKYDRPNKPGES